MFFPKLQSKFRNCLKKWVEQFKFLNPALSKWEMLLCEKAWLCPAQLGGSAFPYLHFWQQTLKQPFQNTASAMLCFTSVTLYCHFNTKNKKGNIPKLLSFPGTAQRRPCCTFSMAVSHKSLYRQQQINYNHGFSKSPWQDILIVVETACAEMIERKSAPFHIQVSWWAWYNGKPALLLSPSQAGAAEGPSVTLQAAMSSVVRAGAAEMRGKEQGGDSAWFRVCSTDQRFGCFDKERPWESEQRQKSGPRKTENR